MLHQKNHESLDVMTIFRWPISGHDQTPTSPDILGEHKRSIAPCNSSDMTSIGNNFNYFAQN